MRMGGIAKMRVAFGRRYKSFGNAVIRGLLVCLLLRNDQ